jgi:tRNA 2-thiouridine synthesizing protein D
MRFSILVLNSPTAAQAGDSAWAFAQAAVDAGHELYRVFFYDEGVAHGNMLATPAQDDVDRQARWAGLAREQGTDLVLCIASAVKRGVLDSGEAERHEKPAANAHPAFELSGLGQLVDAHINSDRLVTFGR